MGSVISKPSTKCPQDMPRGDHRPWAGYSGRGRLCNAPQILKHGQRVTVYYAEGDRGLIFEGELDFDIKQNPVDPMPGCHS